MSEVPNGVRRALNAVDDIDPAMLAGGLWELLWAQADVSALVPGAIDESPTNDQVAYATYALIAELIEVADEVGWKKWKENPEMDSDQALKISEELADVMAFLGQLMFIIRARTGVTPNMVAQSYKEKSRKNVERFVGRTGEDGYVGVIRKGYKQIELFKNKEADDE